MNPGELLARPVTIARWKYHALHAATAALVLIALLALHVSWGWSTLAAGLCWVPIEIVQWIRWRAVSLDALADAITYQPVWIGYAVHEHGAGAAAVVLVIWILLYLGTLRWANP